MNQVIYEEKKTNGWLTIVCPGGREGKRELSGSGNRNSITRSPSPICVLPAMHQERPPSLRGVVCDYSAIHHSPPDEKEA